jgi:hypothetical protein
MIPSLSAVLKDFPNTHSRDKNLSLANKAFATFKGLLYFILGGIIIDKYNSSKLYITLRCIFYCRNLPFFTILGGQPQW